MTVRAGILVIGDEVLEGATADRNGPWLARRLLDRGVEVVGIAVCPDSVAAITSELATFARRGCELVFTSGGLGPTDDDRTVEAVARYANRPLAVDPALEERIGAILRAAAQRWRRFDETALRRSNRKQALVPSGATVLDPVGTAPGLVVPPADGSGGPTVVVLPGPPRELKTLYERAVATPLVARLLEGLEPPERRIVRFFGIPESELARAVREIEEEIPEARALAPGTYVRKGEIELVVRYTAERAELVERFVTALARRFPRELFAADGRTIDDLVADALAGRSVATAESCTGGLVAARLTARPGASAYVRGAVVAYDNAVKEAALGVERDLLARHGAVSREVACAMARGAAERMGAELAVAVTGIAGPGGGSAEKPVGTVWVATYDGRSAQAGRLWLPGDREEVRARAVTAALHALWRAARGEELPF